jgi:hypothetical protein
MMKGNTICPRPFHGGGIKISQFWYFLPHPKGIRGAGNLKFTIYVPLVQKMHHNKFEKNWSCCYQEEVQMLTDTIHHVWPRPGGKTVTPRIIKFTILVEAFLLYITIHSVFPPYVRL